VNLLKTSFYTSISTAISFISGFIVTKVVAVKIGPSGMAYVGQFQNTTAILTMLATGAIAMGVVKYLAEHKEDAAKRQQIINTSFIIVFFSSLIFSLFVMSASGYLSRAAFKTVDFWMVYFSFGILLMVISFNVIFSAILNGLKQIRKFTIVNICNSLIGITITVLFAYLFGMVGVLFSTIITSLIIFFVNIYFFNKLNIKWKPNFKGWDKGTVKLLSRYSLMTLVAGFLAPAAQILIRNKIIVDLSIGDAGYWQAVTKVSDAYLGFITTVLVVYYMPRLSEIQSKSELRNEIFKGYKIILPVVGTLAFLIWLFKNIIIHILFTPEFLPMKSLFTFQLIGDFIKIGSWLLTYVIIAKALTKTYMITEFIFTVSYVALSYFLINRFGLIGTTYAFAINYALYWIFITIIVRKHII
jgi:PST family polysaccharide transporter